MADYILLEIAIVFFALWLVQFMTHRYAPRVTTPRSITLRERKIRKLYRELEGSRRYAHRHAALVSHLAKIYDMTPSEMRHVTG